MPQSENRGLLAGFIAHTGEESSAEPLFKNSMFGWRFMCPACRQPLRHPYITGRMHCECPHCRRGYALEMYPIQREPVAPGNSHEFTHVFYVAVSRRVYEAFEKRLAKLERGDAAHNRAQMERAFLRKLGALEIFESGPPAEASLSEEQRDRDHDEWRRKKRALQRMNSDIVEEIRPGILMKKSRDGANGTQSQEHLRSRKQ